MKLTEGERLIIVMLADIKEKFEISGEIEPDFIKSAIFGRHEWALDWEYASLANPDNLKDPTVTEVCDTLDTWRFLRNGYKHLSAEDRQRVAEHAFIEEDELHFPGFDGNNESEHYSIAIFLVEKMRRFIEVNPHKMNSHSPKLARYRRMNRKFAPIRNELGVARINLTADEMIDILTGA